MLAKTTEAVNVKLVTAKIFWTSFLEYEIVCFCGFFLPLCNVYTITSVDKWDAHIWWKVCVFTAFHKRSPTVNYEWMIAKEVPTQNNIPGLLPLSGQSDLSVFYHSSGDWSLRTAELIPLSFISQRTSWQET